MMHDDTQQGVERVMQQGSTTREGGNNNGNNECQTNMLDYDITTLAFIICPTQPSLAAVHTDAAVRGSSVDQTCPVLVLHPGCVCGHANCIIIEHFLC